MTDEERRKHGLRFARQAVENLEYRDVYESSSLPEDTPEEDLEAIYNYAIGAKVTLD